MALTANERKALEEARWILSERGWHLCNVLEEVAHEFTELRSACARLKSYIDQSLEGAYTLEDWQGARGIQGGGRVDRLAWVEWMLAE